MQSILIKNGRIWDGESFFDADVLTDGGRISEIRPRINAHADFVCDADGKTVSAGLVDAHAHIRGISDGSFAVQAESAAYPFGVTALADAGGVLGNRCLLDSFMIKSAVFAVIDIKENRADFSSVEYRLREYGNRAVGVKLYFDTTVSRVWDETPLLQAREFAARRGLPLMVHSSHSPIKMARIFDILDSGDILTHAFHGGENNAAEDGFGSMSRAQKRGVLVDVGMAGHIHTDFKIMSEALRGGIVPDLLGTDITEYSAFVRGGRYGLTLCMSIARALGMSERDIFRSVSSNPARALGRCGEWGALSVGAVADIAVIDCGAAVNFDLTDGGGNRVCGNKGYRCAMTVSDGKIVYLD